MRQHGKTQCGRRKGFSTILIQEGGNNKDLPSKSSREVEKGDDAKRVKKRLKQKKMERSKNPHQKPDKTTSTHRWCRLPKHKRLQSENMEGSVRKELKIR